MNTNQARQEITNIAERIWENAVKIRYGSVSATLKIHDGRVVDVTHSTTESTREQQEKQK
ncbi:MAG: DUF2292 domain-containing protein [Treponema sp.]|nr:DUF2292 domain-containing protein [Treponema sp.]